MHRLEVRELVLSVKLGCTAKEREIPQEVLVSLDLSFFESPPACLTDRLEDTVCYAMICDAIGEATQNQEFLTVEHLANELVNQLCKNTSLRILECVSKGRIKVHKTHPPIPNLRGGVIFEMPLRTDRR